MAETSGDSGLIGRARKASISVLNGNPQLGMWQAAGTAIAQAPNLTELRDPGSGGDNIEFNAQGHSARIAVQESDGELALAKTVTQTITRPVEPAEDELPRRHHRRHHHGHPHLRALHEKHRSDAKEKWGPTIRNGFKAFWKFFLTPSGFLITIYFLNIVAWGAMLFFLLLKAAPAMNHPSADDNSSPRKIWLEIDSQILNALFCVTGFGLAPWRFRDLYYLIRVVHFRDQKALDRLYKQNSAWFRPPAWSTSNASNRVTDPETNEGGVLEKSATTTFTGEVAPPTPLWKLGFTIWMMVLNTLFQVVLCYFMWGYNRIDRPTWATGTFIGLGCGVAMFAGLMSWWEGRKVKKIEGPQVQIIESPA